MATEINDFRGEYRWLSNFHLCWVKFEGVIYPSSEHAYQAAKVPPNGRLPFKDHLMSCADVKRLGRRVRAREDWDVARLWVMEAVLLDKFTRNADLAHKLLATGEAELVEGNTWGDTFWGMCRGEGQNHLGRLLMALRTNLAGIARQYGYGARIG